MGLDQYFNSYYKDNNVISGNTEIFYCRKFWELHNLIIDGILDDNCVNIEITQETVDKIRSWCNELIPNEEITEYKIEECKKLITILQRELNSGCNIIYFAWY